MRYRYSPPRLRSSSPTSGLVLSPMDSIFDLKRSQSFCGKPSFLRPRRLGSPKAVAICAIHLMVDGVARQTNRTLDRQRTGAAMGDDRHAVQTDQRRAAILGIIQSSIGRCAANCGSSSSRRLLETFF